MSGSPLAVLGTPGVGCLGHCADRVGTANAVTNATDKAALRMRSSGVLCSRFSGALMNRRCFVMVAGIAWLAGATASQAHHSFAAEYDRRSEERRVGKECRSRGTRYQYKRYDQ